MMEPQEASGMQPFDDLSPCGHCALRWPACSKRGFCRGGLTGCGLLQPLAGPVKVQWMADREKKRMNMAAANP
jgi:hypothetical protein